MDGQYTTNGQQNASNDEWSTNPIPIGFEKASGKRLSWKANAAVVLLWLSKNKCSSSKDEKLHSRK